MWYMLGLIPAGEERRNRWLDGLQRKCCSCCPGGEAAGGHHPPPWLCGVYDGEGGDADVALPQSRRSPPPPVVTA
eukprot:gene50185-43540_t